MKKIIIVFMALSVAIGSLLLISCDKSEKLSGYDIEITLENNVVSGKAKVNFVNNTDTSFKQVKFNIFANAFRKDAKYNPTAKAYASQAYYNGDSYGGFEIEAVNCNNEKLNYEIGGVDENILIVELDRELFPDENVGIEIDYKINLANVISRTGINDNTINLANFYPILCGIQDNAFYECVYYAIGDPYFSDCADYKVSISLDKEYVVASSGKLENQKQENGKNTFCYTADNVRNFAFVLSKNFKVLTADCQGVEIKYYYYNDDKAEQSLNVAKQSIEFFSDAFGEYAYDTYSVCQTKFIQGGMEFTGLVMISDNLEPEAYNEVIVHETAHQWWMSAVGNNEIEFGFIDESLAEYSVVMFYENHKEYKMEREIMIANTKKTYSQFCTIYDKLFNKVDTSMIRSLSDFDSEYEYVNIAYIKGCIMYEDLRELIGDDNFKKYIRQYYTEFKFKNVTPDDIVSVFQNYSSSMESFFNGYYSGKVVIGLGQKKVA